MRGFFGNRIAFIIPLMLLLCITQAGAQSLEVLNIDPGGYPGISAEIRAYSPDGFELRDLRGSEFTIIDGEAQRNIVSFDCPEPSANVSYVLVLERSLAMWNDPLDPEQPGKKKFVAMKEAVRSFLDSMDSGMHECAIVLFSTFPTLAAGFSRDFAYLKNELDSIVCVGGTDYNIALLGNKFGDPGAISLAETAQHKPVFVFVTGNSHEDLYEGPLRYDEVREKIIFEGAGFYALTMGATDSASSETLNGWALAGHGRYFPNLANMNGLFDAFSEIFRISKGGGAVPDPCRLVWETGCDGGDVSISFNRYENVTSEQVYKIPEWLKPHLEVSPRHFAFLNPQVGEDRDTTVRIVPKANDAKINSIQPDDSRFIVLGASQNLPALVAQDDTLEVNIRFRPTGTDTVKAEFVIYGTACSGDRFYHDGVVGVERRQDNENGFSLKIRPNPIGESGTIELPEELAGREIEIEVYDFMGRRLSKNGYHAQRIGNNIFIDLKSLVAGVYLIRLRSGQDSIPVSLIKNE